MDVSVMVVANVLYEKKCFIQILQTLDYKGRLFDKRFVIILRARSQFGFPPTGSLEELSATLTMCVKKYGLWRFFLLAWSICEYTQNLRLNSNYCLSFRIIIILIAYHSWHKREL